MPQAQAGIVFIHGAECPPLEWKQTTTRASLRATVEKLLAWLDKQGVNVCERSWGENRRMSQETLSAAVDDFISDHLKRPS
jgi:hypothetical protein